MKNLLILICLSLFSLFSAKAQNNQQWADSGAVWNYTFNLIGIQGYQKTSYTGDTVIMNHLCQKLETFNEVRLPIGPGVFANIPNFQLIPTYYLYMSNDSVFSFRNNVFNLAFKTNAVVGEIWNLGSPSYTNLQEFVKVDSIYYTVYNSSTFRNIKVHPCDVNGDSVVFDLTATDTVLVSRLSVINEKFGPLGSFITIGGGLFNNQPDETLPQYLLCYSSSSFSIYQSGFAPDCFNTILSDGNQDFRAENFIKLYPNPTHDNLNFTVENIAQFNLTLFNNMGVEIARYTNINTPNFSISVGNFPKGFYYYQIQSDRQESFSGKIINN